MFTDKMFSCQLCHRSYSTKYNLNKHMKVHDDSKAFKCDVCLKKFDQKLKLTQHYRTHTGEKPFACQICGRKFSQKSSLVQHQGIHSETKSFKCSVCPQGRFFKTKKGLSNHMVFHFEPKFSCSFCDHKSYTTSDLTKHEKTHVKM